MNRLWRNLGSSIRHRSLHTSIRQPARRLTTVHAALTTVVVGGALLTYQQFQRPIRLDAKAPSRDPNSALVPISSVTLADDEKPEVESETWPVDPDTSIAFPKTLNIPSKLRHPPFTLLGVGVRRVSFLGVKVYSVGFYADLSNPNLRIPENATPEDKIEHIVSNTSCVLRIIPTRNTSFTHLRDGFTRALNARFSAQIKSGSLSSEDAERATSPMRKFKSLFPNTAMLKGVPLDIFVTAPEKNGIERSLVVRDLGGLESDWVAKEFVMAYFEGDGISPPMKKAVVATVSNLPSAS